MAVYKKHKKEIKRWIKRVGCACDHSYELYKACCGKQYDEVTALLKFFERMEDGNVLLPAFNTLEPKDQKEILKTVEEMEECIKTETKRT